MSRVHVGRELERARVDRGESLEDVSARTSINIERLRAIERGDLSELPSLISVKGFVHAFAVAVGLDPDDVSTRYTAQFDTQKILSEFDSEGPLPPDEAVVEPRESARTPWRRAPRTTGQVVTAAPAVAAEGVTFRGQLLQVFDDRAAPPTRGGPYFGRRTLPQRRTPRTAQALLVAVLAVTVGFAAAATVDRVRRNALGASATRQSSVAASTPAPAGDVARVVRDASTTEEPSAANVDASTDLSGGWTFTSRVEANDNAKTQVSVGYRIRLQQRGLNISGTGYRAMENGRIVPLRQRTPVAVEGKLDGHRLELLFSERGDGVTSSGTLVMRVANRASMQGTLWIDASTNHRGSIYAKRVAD